MIVESTVGISAAIAASKIKENSILGVFYKDVAQPSVQTVGKVLNTVLEFSTIPFLAVDYINKRSRLLLTNYLQIFEEKLKDIPQEDLLEVNPQIGVPIIEKLSYTTNEDIATLFINLLAKASSTTTVNQAHPAYVQMIDRLSVDEARILQNLKGKDRIPCITFDIYSNGQDGSRSGYTTALNQVTALRFENDLLFPDNTTNYVDNFRSIGVLQLGDASMFDQSIYQELKSKWNYDGYLAMCKDAHNFDRIDVKNEFFLITEFGKSFIAACTN